MGDSDALAVEYLRDNRDQVLARWLEAQREDLRTRPHLPEGAEAERQSAALLDGVIAAAGAGGIASSSDPAYEPVHRLLGEASVRRERLGFPASATASWVMMLKDAWILPMVGGAESSEALGDAARRASRLVDELAITTYESLVSRREQTILQQADEIMEISTPVIKVWDGVVAAPLIGSLDSERTQRFMERLLETITRTSSPVALVDITGVPTIDTQTAQHLIDTVSAVRLLGSKVILTGVRPSIAQTLIQLGIPMEGITTRSSFAGGLRVALDMLALEVTAAAPAR